MKHNTQLWLLAIAMLWHSTVAGQNPTLTVTAHQGARQTFQGFGFGLNGKNLSTQPSPKNKARLHQLLYKDLNTKVLRLWYRASDNDPEQRFIDDYATSQIVADARKHGVSKVLFAPTGMHQKPSDPRAVLRRYSALFKRLKDHHGLTIDVTGIQNEPATTWKGEDLAYAARVFAYELRVRNLKTRVILPESSNADNTWANVVDSFKKDKDAWGSILGVASHSYNMAATGRWAAYQASGKEYWQTEAGNMHNKGVTAAARFLNDLNHRANYWLWFIGTHGFDGRGNENLHRLVVLNKDGSYTINPVYYYIKQITEAFPVGTKLRYCTTDKKLPNTSMAYTYGRKPAINAAVGKNPDGSWSVGISNNTGVLAGKGSGLTSFYPAQTFDVAITIPELAQAGNVLFALKNTLGNGAKKNAKAGYVTMADGKMVVKNLTPETLATLRSVPAGFGKGHYKIVAKHSGKALSVSKAAIGNWGNVHQARFTGKSHQLWAIEPVAPGQYRIIAKHSGKGLDVSGNSKKNGANVQQYTWGNSANQRWALRPVGGGHYQIRAIHSDKALDVENAWHADGTNVHQWQAGGGANQHWAVTLVSTYPDAATRQNATGAKPITHAGLGTPTVSVYPNPAAGQPVTLTFGGIAAPFAVTVTDLVGKVVFATNAKQAGPISLPTIGLAPGLYHVRAKNQKTSAHASMVVR